MTADLAREHPMHRLLQGEVGSGKTVVALRAMLAVVDSGGQAALLAPTEVLAQQHHRSITAMLGPLAERGLLGGSDLGTRVALLTGSQPTAARRAALLDIVSGDAGIVIGTHALIQDTVEFHDLGLVVVDEQHRFGVEQRDALRSKAKVAPHVLVMTATPIPRTVAMTVFGDLDVSTLTELPAGRSPIASHVVPSGEKPHFLDRAWQRVREEVDAGHQVYVVCPRIGGDVADAEPSAGGEPDPADEATSALRPAVAVLDVAPMLAEGPLAGLRTEVLHGRLPADVKDDVMRRFAAGELDVLVATTVVEVGVGEVLDWPALDDGEGYVATVQPTVRHADPRCVEVRGSQSWVPADHGRRGALVRRPAGVPGVRPETAAAGLPDLSPGDATDRRVRQLQLSLQSGHPSSSSRRV